MSMNREEKYFELLMSEKALADSQIGGYQDLHVRSSRFSAQPWFFSDGCIPTEG